MRIAIVGSALADALSGTVVSSRRIRQAGPCLFNPSYFLRYSRQYRPVNYGLVQRRQSESGHPASLDCDSREMPDFGTSPNFSRCTCKEM